MEQIAKEFQKQKKDVLEVCVTYLSGLFTSKTLIMNSEKNREKQWILHAEYSYTKNNSVSLIKLSQSKTHVLMCCTNKLTGEIKWMDLKNLCRLNKINYGDVLDAISESFLFYT